MLHEVRLSQRFSVALFLATAVNRHHHRHRAAAGSSDQTQNQQKKKEKRAATRTCQDERIVSARQRSPLTGRERTLEVNRTKLPRSRRKFVVDCCGAVAPWPRQDARRLSCGLHTRGTTAARVQRQGQFYGVVSTIVGFSLEICTMNTLFCSKQHGFGVPSKLAVHGPKVVATFALKKKCRVVSEHSSRSDVQVFGK